MLGKGYLLIRRERRSSEVAKCLWPRRRVDTYLGSVIEIGKEKETEGGGGEEEFEREEKQIGKWEEKMRHNYYFHVITCILHYLASLHMPAVPLVS